MIRWLLSVIGLSLLMAGDVPSEITSFIGPNHRALEAVVADLNRDGRLDYLVVLEPAAEPGEGSFDERPRPLLVILRLAGGTLELAARNDRAIYCRSCGGMMGDPFQGVKASPGRFTIQHYGGSGWRWSNDATFAWSRRDRAWQLVEVKTESFHAADPDSGEMKSYRPPKDFGKIDFREFDPENWEGVGPK